MPNQIETCLALIELQERRNNDQEKSIKDQEKRIDEQEKRNTDLEAMLKKFMDKSGED